MEYEIIYSIALDLIDKRYKQKGSSFREYETVCVLITDSSNIFSRFSKHIMNNHNQFETICAEKETLAIMSRAGEIKISALIVVDCVTRMPIVPCKDCRNKILSVNQENCNTLVMLPNGKFVKFYETYTNNDLPSFENVLVNNINSSAIDINASFDDYDDSWDIGWDSTETTEPPKTNTIKNSIDDNISNDNGNQVEVENYSNDTNFYNPDENFSKSSSSNDFIYKNRINSVLNDELTKDNKTSVNVATPQKKRIGSVLKKRLMKFIDFNEIQTTQLHKYTKKELIAMAKYKKKQAKKDKRILENLTDSNY